MHNQTGRSFFLAAFTLLFCFGASSVVAQNKPVADKKPDPLPAGTYYILNSASGDAITPANSSSGQNVFLQEFTKDGSQQWKVIVKNKKYIIQLNGFSDLLFQPHPSVKDHTPIISLPGLGNDQFTIEPAGKGIWIIKNQNGNPLYAPEGSADKELRFGPVSNSNKNHIWEFRPLN